MSKFLIPYHFIPTPGEISAPGLVKRNVTDWPQHLTHDRFVSKTDVDGVPEDVYSGRMVCRAVVQELLAVGSAQSGSSGSNEPRKIELFQLGGTYALPGSSLRGMLAAIAEAATNSTLRILTDGDLALKPNGGHPTNPGGSVHDFFRRRNPNLVPLFSNDKRTHITVAEQLFGFVEQVGPESTPGPALALASRLRVSHALAHGTKPETTGEQVTKILGSPKFRYPSFYFNATEQGEFISRDNDGLKLKRGHFPKGRKFYLHREKAQKGVDGSEWITANPNDSTKKQKTRVAPLESGEFWFHLDFTNLSLLELQILCYSVTPSDAFFHKLGLGKPLGLGKLKLDPMGLFLIDRKSRYTGKLNGSRYYSAWKRLGQDLWPVQYETESKTEPTTGANSPVDLRNGYRSRIEKFHPHLHPVIKAIELLGNPDMVDLPVHYPQLEKQDLERKLFLWFSQNEKCQGQFLRSLTGANTCNFTELPALDRKPSSSPPAPSCWKGGIPPAIPHVPTTAPALPIPASAVPKSKLPSIPAGIEWQGPVLCRHLGESKSGKLKFCIHDGQPQASGVLSEDVDPAQVPADLRENHTYHMEFLPIGKANYRFRFV